MVRHLLVLLALGACHKPHATKELFGVKVTPPGILSKVRPGMTLAELTKLAPDAKLDPAKGYALEHPATNVTLYALVTDGLVSGTYIDLVDDHALALLTDAWGPPDAEPSRENHKDPTWRSTTTGWRASAFCSRGSENQPAFCTVELHPHKPLEEMFAHGIVPAGEFATVTQDMSPAQIAAATHLPITETTSLLRRLDYDGAQEIVSVIKGQLYRLDYTLPALARPMIEKAWGPGTPDVTKKDEPASTTWCDDKTHWCATLSKSGGSRDELDLEFSGYLPFDQELALLDSLTKLQIADAIKAHPELLWHEKKQGEYTDHYIELPLTEYTEPASRIAKHVIASAFPATSGTDYVWSTFDVAAVDAIVATLSKRWGTAKKTVEKGADSDADRTHYEWTNGNMVTLNPYSVTINLGPLRPKKKT